MPWIGVAAQKRVRALRGYADYHQMLERERPDLFGLVPRWTDQHRAMVGVVLRSGAQVHREKPFTRTLAEADELVVRRRGIISRGTRFQETPRSWRLRRNAR